MRRPGVGAPCPCHWGRTSPQTWQHPATGGNTLHAGAGLGTSTAAAHLCSVAADLVPLQESPRSPEPVPALPGCCEPASCGAAHRASAACGAAARPHPRARRPSAFWAMPEQRWPCRRRVGQPAPAGAALKHSAQITGFERTGFKALTLGYSDLSAPYVAATADISGQLTHAYAFATTSSRPPPPTQPATPETGPGPGPGSGCGRALPSPGLHSSLCHSGELACRWTCTALPSLPTSAAWSEAAELTGPPEALLCSCTACSGAPAGLRSGTGAAAGAPSGCTLVATAADSAGGACIACGAALGLAGAGCCCCMGATAGAAPQGSVEKRMKPRPWGAPSSSRGTTCTLSLPSACRTALLSPLRIPLPQLASSHRRRCDREAAGMAALAGAPWREAQTSWQAGPRSAVARRSATCPWGPAVACAAAPPARYGAAPPGRPMRCRPSAAAAVPWPPQPSRQPAWRPCGEGCTAAGRACPQPPPCPGRQRSVEPAALAGRQARRPPACCSAACAAAARCWSAACRLFGGCLQLQGCDARGRLGSARHAAVSLAAALQPGSAEQERRRLMRSAGARPRQQLTCRRPYRELRPRSLGAVLSCHFDSTAGAVRQGGSDCAQHTSAAPLTHA